MKFKPNLLLLLVLLLIFSPNMVKAQDSSTVYSVDTLLIGDWYLDHQRITSFEEDSTHYFPPFLSEIAFTPDSIILQKTEPRRFYTPSTKSFTYEISHNALTLYSWQTHRRKNKNSSRVEEANFEILLCTTDQLVLSYYLFDPTPLGNNSFKIILTYKRKAHQSLQTQLTKTWFTCLDNHPKNKDTIYFTPSTPPNCKQNTLTLEINPSKAKIAETFVTHTSNFSGIMDGVFLSHPYMLEQRKEKTYLHYYRAQENLNLQITTSYEIVSCTAQELILYKVY
ncbi:hypothetical protein SAMN05216474_2062 [Lishizhenia tianjinensis]|uniref:Lipocalin-like domain-containing protein n=1 Tax=Lishizhenia tianjinensis TaxID=477690 RepID=A0A1I7AG73_9FLAO|nr:hypothetical protein [Lishizhenia tianjinensis]SFT73951.1 hypothetical protein SAMN05216474_2062 [Lishizhenia tianjinensis]